MGKRITIKEIARQLDVSTATVSRALIDAYGISNHLREKIKSLNPMTVFLFLAIAIQCCNKTELVTGPKNPNILLILTDDMGFGDVGNSGNPIIQTPNLDRLATKSIRFNHFYVSPVCAPTRASLLTGRYHQRTGVRSVTNGYETMDPDEVTLAEILKGNGYRTGIFGKWHLGEYYPSVPNAQGFDEYLGFRTGHSNHYYDATIEHNGKPLDTRGHITDVLTDAALGFMTSNQTDPFFCYLAYNAPHTPLQIDSAWWTHYSEKGLNERTSRVYGMIEHVDKGIGMILDSLDGKNLLKNTVVIFMSDNGPIDGWQVPQEQMRYNVGLRDQKFTVYEGGIRTQCYWMWDERWNTIEVPQIAAHIDVVPTLLDLIGIEPLSELDGVSLLPALTGKNGIDDRTFFQKYSLQTLLEPAPFPGGIARKGSWKMVDGKELYNVVEDVGEEINRSDQYPEILVELNEAYLQWYDDIFRERNLQPIGITLGYDQENPVYLQPHHAIASGNVEFWGNRGLTGERTGTHPKGVDSDWTGSWKAEGDAIQWDVSFVKPGDYVFKIIARDASNQETNALRLFINEQSVGGFDSPLYLNPDWTEHSVGRSTLSTGNTSIKLVLEEDSKANLEIRALVVEKL